MKIIVGSQIFETIKYIPYIHNMITDAEQGDINIDRSAKIFEHILNLARDVDYKFPKKCKSELGFYVRILMI